MTASGAMPTANHAGSCDEANLLQPIGKHKVVKERCEHVVQILSVCKIWGKVLDVYLRHHAAASAKGHITNRHGKLSHIVTVMEAEVAGHDQGV